MNKGFAISLLCNAALVAALLLQAGSPHRGALSGSVAIQEARPGRRAPSTLPSPRSSAIGDVAPIGGDWRSWIEPLRAAMPNRVLAELVGADFDRRWQRRQAELQQNYLRGEIDSDGLAASSIEHDVAFDRELQEALGPEAYRAWDMARVLDGLNVDRVALSDSERGAVYDLERALRDRLRQDQAEKLHGAIDQATLTFREQTAQNETTEKLRALLGADRTAQLHGFDDAEAAVKRMDLGMALTNEQIASLADAQRRWDTTRSDLVTQEVNTGDRSIENALETQEEQWRRRVDEVLGPGGFERYAKAQDSRFAELSRNAARWGVPAGEVDRVFSTIENFEDAVHEYSHDAGVRDVDPLARDAAIRHLAEETERSLESKLGARTYEILKRNGVNPVATP